MNNEEKILEILLHMQSEIAGLKEGQASLEREVHKTNAILENEIRPNIRLLAEGHKGVVEKLDKLDGMAEELEDVKDSVSILKLLHIKRD